MVRLFQRRADIMNEPHLIVADDFSAAWAKAVINLKSDYWSA